jgi:hypothetical protein
MKHELPKHKDTRSDADERSRARDVKLQGPSWKEAEQERLNNSDSTQADVSADDATDTLPGRIAEKTGAALDILGLAKQGALTVAVLASEATGSHGLPPTPSNGDVASATPSHSLVIQTDTAPRHAIDVLAADAREAQSSDDEKAAQIEVMRKRDEDQASAAVRSVT